MEYDRLNVATKFLQLLPSWEEFISLCILNMNWPCDFLAKRI